VFGTATIFDESLVADRAAIPVSIGPMFLSDMPKVRTCGGATREFAGAGGVNSEEVGESMSTRRITLLLVEAFAFLVLSAPLSAQVGDVIYGRVEDALSRAPVAGVQVSVEDPAGAVYTDSAGEFAILIETGKPLSLHLEGQGYISQRFDLPEEAPSRLVVLLMEPAVIELEGIDVVAESAIARVLRDLRGRRNAYMGSMTAFDRAQLDRFGTIGSAWDFVRQRVPEIFECRSALSGLCVRGRSRSFENLYPEDPVSVCVDSWTSWGAVRELENLDMHGVALVEIFGRGRGGIRIYTSAFILSSARTGRNVAPPLGFGC